MPVKQYPFIDIAVHERVRPHFARGEAAVLLSPDLARVLWSNGEGAALFGQTSIYDFLDAGIDRSGVAARQIDAAIRQLPDAIGTPRTFMMRISAGFRSLAIGACVERIAVHAGETAVLFTAPPAGRSLSLAERAERMIAGFDDPDTHMAVLDGDGAVIASSAGFDELAMSDATRRMLVGAVARDRDWLVKRPVATGKGHLPAAIGKLSDDPALHLLFAVETILGHLDAVEDDEADMQDAPHAAPVAMPETETADVRVFKADADAPVAADATAASEAVQPLFTEPSSQPVADVPFDAPTENAANEETGIDPVSSEDAPEVDAEAVDEDEPLPMEPVLFEPAPMEPGQEEISTPPFFAVEEAPHYVFSQPAAAEPAFVFNRTGRAVRFVWKIDSDGRFQEISDEFAAAVGPNAANIAGESFEALAARYGLDQDGTVTELLRRRDTWSGKTIFWPVDGTGLRVPIDMAALPTYSRQREFDGFRGFGIVRVADAIENDDIDADASGQIDEVDEPTGTDDAALTTSDALFPVDEPETAPAEIDPEPEKPDLIQPEIREPLATLDGMPEIDDTPLVETEALERTDEQEPEIGLLPESADDIPVEAFDSSAEMDRPEPAVEDDMAEATDETALPEPEAVSFSGEDQQGAGAPQPDHSDDEAGVDRFESDAAVDDRIEAEAEAEDAGQPESDPQETVEDNQPADPSNGATALTTADLADAAVLDPFQGERPALQIVATEGRRSSDKIIQLESHRMQAREALTRSEQAAFREIARQLGKVMDDDAPSPPAFAADTIDVEDLSPLVDMAAIDATQAEDAGSAAEPGNETGGELTATLIDAMPVALLIHTGDALLHANPEFLTFTGYDTLNDLRAEGGLDALFAGDEDGDFDLPEGSIMMMTRDGHLIPVLARLSSVRWESRSALLIAIAPAASNSEKAADTTVVSPQDDPVALRREADELRSILETATDGVVTIGEDGEIRSLNRSAAALFNYDDEDTRGKPFAMLFAHESQKAVLDYISGLAGHGVASVLNDGREVIGREISGGFIPLFITMGHLPSSKGYCAVIRDITQWKRTEDELRTAKRSAETANAHKTEFLARVSHEIRTPLNAIIGFSDMMASEHFGPIGNARYVEYAHDIGRSGRHVLDIVNDLLDISKIEAGAMELDFTAVELNEAISEAVSLVQPQANAQRVIIRTSLSGTLPDIVADDRSIKQIALNILSNAIRFTPSGGQIVVSTGYEPNGSVILRIRDTGVGMTRTELEQAMKPFRQVTSGARKRGDGTGLGLPLTKAMVEANRAQFSINSAPNEGTLVEIVFPSQRVLAD